MTASAPSKVLLGTVDLPSGVLLVLDPGLARYWSHDQPPAPDKWTQTDFAITGKDAVVAARAFDRQFDPGFLFDIPEKGIPDVTRSFEALCAERGFEAALVPLEKRMPHLERARSALAADNGLSGAQYAGMWAVVADGFAKGARLTAYATPMPPGEFEGRWLRIELIDETGSAGAEVRSREVEGVMVDHGQFIFSDLEAFGEFRMWDSLDGLGDFVFWGADAAALAAEMSAEEVEERHYGWKDVPLEELKARVRPVADAIDERKLRVGQDYRPHCNLEKLNAQIRTTDTEAGTLTLAGSRVLGMRNSWGDGIFPVTCHYDATGRVVRVSMELGTEKRCRTLRQLFQRSRLAIISKSITRDAGLLRFGERDEPQGDGDSGWVFHSGTENDEEVNDPDHYQAMQLGRLIDQTPGLGMCLDLPVGSLIRREGDGFVVE